MTLLAELKRRNVLKVGAAYAVVAWLLVQVAATVSPQLNLPEWAPRLITLLLMLGFPIALLLAWFLDHTPEGIKVEPASTGNKRIVGVSLVLAVVAFGWYLRDAREARPAPARATAVESASGAASTAVAVTPAPSVTDKSIAVLPFADFSANGDHGWFADGLAEEILNALARTPDLLVSARTSSFRYKGSDLAIPQIAKELGVAHVLEGSVRSTPQRIRVTAQLIRAADGFHLWSQTYDRDIADMIEIQEDLARQIAVAMQTSMDPQALTAMAAVGTRSVDAYQAYVRGVAKASRFDPADFQDAYAYFEQARTLDPAFAAAHARAAMFWLAQLDPTGTVSGLTAETPEQVARHFGERIDLAIAHAANETDRLGYRSLKAQRELRLREAIELAQALLAARPGDDEALDTLLIVATQLSDRELAAKVLDDTWPQAQVHQQRASAHLNSAHRNLDLDRAADQAMQLFERWPDEPGLLYQVHRALLWDRRVEDAAVVLARWQSLTGRNEAWSVIPPARQACAEGRRADVEAILAGLPADDVAQRWHLLMLLGNTGEAADLLQPLERAGNTYALAGFLAYPQFDPAPYPSLMRVLEREKVQRPPPVPLPFACPPAAASLEER